MNLNLDDFVLGVVDLDLSKLTDKVERINITLSSKVLRRLDRLAQSIGETRSGYIAKLVTNN